MRKLMLLLPLLLTITGARAGEVRVDRVDILEKGVFALETGEQTQDPGTPTGEITAVTTARLLDATETIPARVGTEFGFRYVVVGEPDGTEVALDIVNLYPAPGLSPPGGEAPLRRSDYRRTRKIGEAAYLGYGFENAWETVPGTWTFEIWHDGRKLAEQSFTVE